MLAALSTSEQHTLGLILVGSGLLFSVEPVISLTSAATYRSVNKARRERRVAILWPVGLVMLFWGALCLWVSVPPRHVAQWLLLLLALPCLGKGLATILFSARLADVSEGIEANQTARRSKCIVGLMIGAALVGWGVTLLRPP